MNKSVIISTTISFVIIYLIACYLGAESREVIRGIVIGIIGSYAMQEWVAPAIKRYWRR